MPRRVLITAGPTQEPIDRVRFIGNRSSGRMGVALAEAALNRGCTVTLLLGPTAINSPNHSQLCTKRFQTTAELQALLDAEWTDHDVLFMAAAVADYRPAKPFVNGKIARSESRLTLEMESTPDLLANISNRKRPGQVIIGFALEPADQLEKSATEKLQRKKLDAIVANPLETMESFSISATVIFADGTTIRAPGEMSKADFAAWLIETVEAECRM